MKNKKGVSFFIIIIILVSIFSIFKILNYKNTKMGNNIVDKTLEEGALIINNPSAPLKIGFVQGDYYYLAWPGKEGLFKYNEDSSKDYCAEDKQKCEHMKDLTSGLYEAARYITFHHTLEE